MSPRFPNAALSNNKKAEPRMNDFRATFQRIGTPDAITWTSFWVTFIAVIGGHFSAPNSSDHAPLRILCLIIAHCAMFVPLVAWRWVLLRYHGRPRPWLTLLAFLLASIVRGLVLFFALRTLADVSNISLSARVFIAAWITMISLTFTALAISSFRAAERDAQRLEGMRQSLKDTSDLVATQIQRRNEDAIAQVQKRLTIAVSALEGVTTDQVALERLRHLATDVIRPMSHELARSSPTVTVPLISDQSTRAGWRATVEALSQRGQFLPVTTASVIVLLYIPSAFLTLPERGLPVLASITAFWITLTLGNRALDRALPRSTPVRSAMLVMLVSIASSAPVVAIGGLLAIGGVVGRNITVGGIVSLPLAAIIGALLRSRVSAQRAIANDLEQLTRRLSQQLVHLRQAQWYHERSLLRALHGDMQSAVTVAAIRLDRALADGAVPPHLLTEIRESITEQIDVLSAAGPQPATLDQLANRLTTTWSRVCNVSLDIDETVRAALDNDDILRSTITEIMTEAVSNSIRHGQAKQVEITLDVDTSDQVRLRVDDDGVGHVPTKGQGLGSTFLDECTSEWSSKSSDLGHRLEARLPIQVPELAPADIPVAR